MPELPEVETVRRQMAPVLTGATFEAVLQVEPFMLRDCSADEVRRLLPGAGVADITRLGKFIVVRLEGDAGLYLTLHLGMTGQILLLPTPGRAEGLPAAAAVGRADDGEGRRHAHTRFMFRLRSCDGVPVLLEFRDARKFGRLHLTTGGPAPRLFGLGPDAWQGEWDVDHLAARLAGRRVPLKAFLLDQRYLAGIGNIYADEILWWTGLSPLRQAGTLDAEEVDRLAGEIRLRLGEGVRRLGCTLSDFVDTEGRPGTFQERLEAYGRQGETCSRCGETLKRVVIAGRGTAYCPGCQR